MTKQLKPDEQRQQKEAYGSGQGSKCELDSESKIPRGEKVPEAETWVTLSESCTHGATLSSSNAPTHRELPPAHVFPMGLGDFLFWVLQSSTLIEIKPGAGCVCGLSQVCCWIVLKN